MRARRVVSAAMAVALTSVVWASQAELAAYGALTQTHEADLRSTARPAGHEAEALMRRQRRITAADGAPGNGFGYSVGVSGSLVVVGAPNHQVGQNVDQGAAYVFAKSGSKYVQIAELTASDGAAYDYFGQSVAIAGTTIVVGAPVQNEARSGNAYVFTEVGSSFVQTAELTAADAEAPDEFGMSVAISGYRIVVGAPDHEVGSNPDQGAAYVFGKSGSSYVQRAELIAPDGEASDAFGYSVGITGSTVVVGASLHVASNGSGGSAYVFTRSGSSWPEIAELNAPEGTPGEFGYAVAISGSTIVVGDWAQNSGQGGAYLFTKSGSSWPSTGSVSDPVPADYEQFGQAVAISGSRVLVGAQEQTVGTNAIEGEVFIFPGPEAPPTEELLPRNGGADDYFGHSVAISGSTVVVGALGEDEVQGAAYVFTGL